MEGFQIKDISTDQIIMMPAGNDWFLWIFVLIGLLGVGLFVLARLRALTSVPQHLHYVLLGFGLVFSSGGFLFMQSDGPERIFFDRSQSSMIIEEQSGDDAKETRIPFAQLAEFVIQPKTDLLVSQSSFEQKNGETGLYLFKKSGGYFLLSCSPDRPSLIRDAESLSSFTGISFIQKDTTRLLQSIQPKDDSIIQKHQTMYSNSGLGMTTEWNEYGSLWELFFLGFVIIGFNVIIFKAPFPSRLRRVIMAIFIIVLDAVMLGILLFNFFGYHKLEVDKSTISYRHCIGSYELSRQDMNTGEVGLVQCGMTAGEPGLLIISRNGIQILSSLMAKYHQGREPGLSEALSIFSMFSALSREMIQIESHSLSFRTRYENEQVIRSFSR